MEINNALAKWAERTTVFYNEVAARLGDDAPAFYTQSPLQKMNVRKLPINKFDV